VCISTCLFPPIFSLSLCLYRVPVPSSHARWRTVRPSEPLDPHVRGRERTKRHQHPAQATGFARSVPPMLPMLILIRVPVYLPMLLYVRVPLYAYLVLTSMLAAHVAVGAFSPTPVVLPVRSLLYMRLCRDGPRPGAGIRICRRGASGPGRTSAGPCAGRQRRGHCCRAAPPQSQRHPRGTHAAAACTGRSRLTHVTYSFLPLYGRCLRC
jgi:hypothetical protein